MTQIAEILRHQGLIANKTDGSESRFEVNIVAADGLTTVINLWSYISTNPTLEL